MEMAKQYSDDGSRLACLQEPLVEKYSITVLGDVLCELQLQLRSKPSPKHYCRSFCPLFSLSICFLMCGEDLWLLPANWRCCYPSSVSFQDPYPMYLSHDEWIDTCNRLRGGQGETLLSLGKAALDEEGVDDWDNKSASKNTMISIILSLGYQEEPISFI